MTNRSIRRANERKALKAARKAAKLTNTTVHTPETPKPVSEAQLAANRANAQLSTGPTSETGKAIASRNHTTHGLTALPESHFQVLPNENQAAYDKLLNALQTEWKPTTATEHELVTRLAVHCWLGDRALRLQHAILAEVGERIAVEERKDFSLFMRYHATHTRSFSKALSELVRLRNFQTRQQTAAAIAERRAMQAQIRFESQKQKAELHAARMEALRLKQEAIKQRNQASAKPTTITSPTEIVVARSANAA